jgi:hypothetical protein
MPFLTYPLRYRFLVFLMAGYVLILFSLPALAQVPQQISTKDDELIRDWHRTWLTAAPEAVRKNQPLFVLALMDSCPDCHTSLATLREAFPQGAFRQTVRLALHLEKVDPLFTAHQMGIKRTPTVIVYQPKGEQLEEVFRLEGPFDTRQWRSISRRIPSSSSANVNQTTSTLRQRRRSSPLH